MCVGRYAAKVMRNERSEMEHNRSEMPAKSHNKHASQRDAISPPKGNLMLSHSAGMHNTDISIAGICPNKFERAKGSKRFHFASLISHNLRCIPAYAHQIPNGISSQLLRDNTYTIIYFSAISTSQKILGRYTFFSVTAASNIGAISSGV